MSEPPDGTSETVAPLRPMSEILIVDDTPADLRVLSELLSAQGYRVRVAVGGRHGLTAAGLAPPDLILLDVVMPGTDGYEVCRQLKDDSATSGVPVLFLSGLDSTENKVRAFEAGGEDYVTKPFQAAEVLARVRTHLARRQAERALREANRRLETQLAEIRALQAELREQAIRDSLTGLFNRRFLLEALDLELARARREGHAVGVVIMDVDDFKRLNDALGHTCGDRVLKALADQLRARTRQEDVACRYGGDEFVVVLPGAPVEAALDRAEQWRAAIERLRVVCPGGEAQPRMSVGVAASPGHGATGEALLNAADRALYAAKAGGRNRVVAAG